MRQFVLAGLVCAAAWIVPQAVQAAPAGAGAMDTGSGIVLVEGGCGPGGFRAANGYCYPRRPPPPRYRRRACAPGFHLTPYGCRRNF